MLYLDTSVFVSALTNEAATLRAQQLLASQDAEMLAISEWVVTEFSSALSIKLRTGQINVVQRSVALSSFLAMVTASMAIFPILPLHFRTAARYADQHALGLRAGDALHLAVAVEHGATLHTLDRTLAAAGAALGASTVLV